MKIKGSVKAGFKVEAAGNIEINGNVEDSVVIGGNDIIIAGGYDKGIDFDELGRQIASNAKAAVLIGQTAGKIAESILKYAKSEKQIEMADSLETAVKLAGGVAAEGDVVLFSPGCASYDMFTNFQQRGEEFMRLLTESND